MTNVLARSGWASAHRACSASDIVAAFNTWSFKREQPDSDIRLRACVEAALKKQAPIEFAAYWGKGPRARLAAPDTQCLAFLQKMLRRINDVYEFGAGLHILLTDTHAELNQYPAESIEGYFTDIEREAQARGLKTRRLKDVVESANLQATDTFELPHPALRSALRESASKWYLGSADHDAIALTYFQKNMLEKRAVGVQYPEAIFITFNNSKFRHLFPDNMPIFYMYSLKRGVAVKPWFIGDDDRRIDLGNASLSNLSLIPAE